MLLKAPGDPLSVCSLYPAAGNVNLVARMSVRAFLTYFSSTTVPILIAIAHQTFEKSGFALPLGTSHAQESKFTCRIQMNNR